MHIDTMWKFSEMIEFRDKMAEDLGLELIVHINPEGKEMGMNRLFTVRPHTDVMKTQGLKQASTGTDSMSHLAVREEMKKISCKGENILSETKPPLGPQTTTPELWNVYNARKTKVVYWYSHFPIGLN